MKRTAVIVAHAILAAALGMCVRAQPVVTCPRAPAPPILDGNVTVDEWIAAGRVSPFVLLHDAGLPREATDVRVMYDDDALYIGAVLQDADTDSLRTEVTTTDGDVYRDDCFEFFIDALGTGKSYVHIAVNAIGTRFDEVDQDRAASVVWSHGVVVRAGEWSVELSIPFTGNRPPGEGASWHVGAARYQARLDEYSSWNGFTDSFHEAQRFGELHFGGPHLSFALVDWGAMRLGRNVALLHADNASAETHQLKANVRVHGRDRTGHYFRSTKLAAPSGARTPVSVPYEVTQDGLGSLLLSVSDSHGQAIYRTAAYPIRIAPVAGTLFEVESALANANRAWAALPESEAKSGLGEELDGLAAQWRELERYVAARATLGTTQLQEVETALRALLQRVEVTAMRIRAASQYGGALGAVLAVPVGSLTKVFPDTAPPSAATEVRLEVARNETEAFQVAVVSLVDEPLELLIEPSPLTGPGGTIGPEQLAVSVVGYVPASDHLTPGADKRLWPDILAPIGDVAAGIEMEPGRTQALWVSLAVPADVVPGEYTGEITLRPADLPAARVPLRVVVHNPVLPSPGDYHLCVGFWQAPERIAEQYGLELWSAAHWDLVRAYLADMAAHGQKLGMVTRRMFEWRLNDAGEPEFQYTLLDRYVGLCREVGIDEGIEYYSMFSGGGDSTVTWADANGGMHSESCNPGDERFDSMWSAFLSDFATHLEEKGWLENVFICPTDEPRDSPGVPTLERFAHCAELVRAAHPELKTTVAVDSLESARTLAPHIDRMVFKLRDDVYDRDLAAQERDAGGRVEAYICCHPQRPNTFIPSPNIDSRVVGWLLYREGLTGLLRWSYERWPPDPMGQPEGDGRYAAGDLFIVYPGPEGPYATPRWEILRDGFEDYELLWLLEEAISAARARGASEQADAARKALDDAVTQAVGPGPGLAEFTEDPKELHLARVKVLTTLDWLAGAR